MCSLTKRELFSRDAQSSERSAPPPPSPIGVNRREVLCLDARRLRLPAHEMSANGCQSMTITVANGVKR